ncbi:MAG: PAS domain S-box protein [Sphaerotilus sulfidivorans]|uniref:PAS domain S-box protein n=1 Tax=Sphaerotilus sulfidivorans TaxID=639200 RepID=UPI003F31D5E5
MRTNLPITQREYAFPAGQALVSTTDLQGRILYCNPAFIEVSGYTREELLGQPHNMIRHPDMPEEAFRDMWQTSLLGHGQCDASARWRPTGGLHVGAHPA